MPVTALGTFCWVFVSSALLWEETVAQQKFCGDTLAQALDLICINGYNVLLINPYRKRSDSDMGTTVVTNDEDDSAWELKLTGYPLINRVNPFLAKIFNNMLISERHRRSQKRSFKGIYDECCTQGCTYSELSAYCRPA